VPVEIVMPRLSDTMDRGTVARWMKQTGDPVKRGEVLLEIETDKANMDLESYADGILARIIVTEGETAEVGTPIGIVAANEDELKEIQQAAAGGSSPSTREPEKVVTPVREAPADVVHTATDTNGSGRIKASPLAKRVAEERGVDLSRVTGTGPGGRITREDVEKVAQQPQAVPASAPAPQPIPVAVPAPVAPAPLENDEEIQLTRMQQAVARRLSESKISAPHFYVTTEIDMTHSVRFREQINDAEPDLRLTFNDLIVKAVGVVLEKFPAVNASYQDGKVVRHAAVNVGVAVDLPDGLIVPVLKDVNKKSLSDVAGETKRLIAASREGRLKQGDLEGGTFTVSNLGMYGVDQFTAIINPPESAILAIGAIVEKPVVVDGEIVVRRRMRVTLSSDHRVIYGGIAAQFLAELRRTLEHPVLAVL
jgi:pyruvate dehydrogenase E2 component (dihydrolipoamide acetyltransferase)